ncbi:MAG: glycosyltransferase family 2 protein [bacterium]|nr:glycosyltransferase family 2 protein [bacterium]
MLPCLRSLTETEQGIPFDVIVADNGSSDGSVESIKSQFPDVKVVLLGENRGFGVACNAGIKVAQDTAHLLLNPDTIVRPYALGRMYNKLAANPHWGIVGARMLTSAGVPYRAARRFPTVRDLVIECIPVWRVFPNTRTLNSYLYGELAVETLDAVDQVEGSCLMISREAYRKIGLIDERFFVFFEEVDWCRRVKEAGYEIHVVQEAEVEHHLSTTMSRNLPRTRVIHATSAMNYYRKWDGARGYEEVRRQMKRALLVRIALLAPLALFSERHRIRLRGALNERAAYVKGLTA